MTKQYLVSNPDGKFVAVIKDGKPIFTTNPKIAMRFKTRTEARRIASTMMGNQFKVEVA